MAGPSPAVKAKQKRLNEVARLLTLERRVAA